MLRKLLPVFGFVSVSLPLAVQAQLHVAPGGILNIGSGGVVAVKGGDVTALDNISGNGQLVLNGSSQQNLGGAAGKEISAEVVIDNGANVALSAVTRVAGNMNFVAGKLVAGNYNLVFTGTGTASGYGEAANRYIVTNGSGFVTKEGLAQNAAFTFPVGRSLATGDYNQAVVTNSEAATRDFSVQVKNKAESGVSSGNAARGIDRFWNIWSSQAGNAEVALQHKAGEAGNNFDNNSAFVTQQTTASNWKLGTNAAATSLLFTHKGTFIVPATPGITSQFSKSNDELNSITPFMGLSPVALLQGPYNGSTMNTALRAGNLIPLSQPYNVAPFNYAGNETVTNLPSNVTDWVLVELRDPLNPASIVARRAGLMRNDGQIVDIDGTSALYFRNLAPGNYQVAVRHRNHLGIRTSIAQTFVLDLITSYDFTTGMNQAYGSNPMVAVGGGKFAMWGGNTDGNTVVANSAFPSDNSGIVSIINNHPANSLFHLPSFVIPNTYSIYDTDLDGSVRNSSFPSDLSIIVNNVSIHPSNSLFHLPSFVVTEQL